MVNPNEITKSFGNEYPSKINGKYRSDEMAVITTRISNGSNRLPVPEVLECLLVIAGLDFMLLNILSGESFQAKCGWAHAGVTHFM